MQPPSIRTMSSLSVSRTVISKLCLGARRSAIRCSLPDRLTCRIVFHSSRSIIGACGRQPSRKMRIPVAVNTTSLASAKSNVNVASKLAGPSVEAVSVTIFCSSDLNSAGADTSIDRPSAFCAWIAASVLPTKYAFHT